MAAAGRATQNMNSAPLKILLVEDSPSDAALLRESLTQKEFGSIEFAHVETWAEAVKNLRQGQFDILLLDLSLPDSAGRDTFLQARAEAPHLPIVVLTGVEDEVIGLDAVRHGIQDYLIKGQADGRQIARAIRYAIERKLAEEELQKLNRILRALGNSNQALMCAREESEFLEGICKIVVEDCGHAMVWIGYAEEDEGKTVRPVAHAGFEEGYLETLKVTWADTERGRGPTGTAIRTGKPAECRNMLTDPKFKLWREEAIKRGYVSSLVLPLLAGSKAFGSITIYSREPDRFSEDEKKLLTELASDIANGIMTIRMRLLHAKTEAELLRERDQLEVRVRERTAELSQINRSLQEEIAQRQRAEEAHRQVLRRLKGAEETERGRISREMHDRLGQDLTALKLGLQLVKKQGPFTPSVQASISQLEKLADTLMQDIHRLAWELRPAALDDFGLDMALRRYASEWSEHNGVAADFHSQGVETHRLPAELETTLYRITQEALTNVLRHAKAQHVGVILERRPDHVLLIVEDDGRGFDAQAVLKTADAHGKLGLLGMQERVILANGTIEIESAPGAGTTVFVRIPLKSKMPAVN
jgi:signal transduction histidine kinase/DNA-binding NarL/FixJ family response regulator